ncbi:phage tail tape measure protein [Aerococcaceae bacterium zg-ZUI334]|uniref:phage tail tape measure protein n=1 Tax=Aerococcaceae bacterium zg-252 TaxID=2796928 RepID=UPI001B8EFA7D|nr:phage tail tape measure protein [Aerococcaceae bacterium zg-ZUI334]
MAENIVGKLVVELDFDGARFEKGITAAKRELQSYGKSVQTSTQWAKDSNYAMDASRVALNNMQVQYKAMNATKQEYLRLMQEEESAGRRGGAAYARYSRQVNNLTNDQYALNQQYIELQKQTAIANSKFTKMGEFLGNVGTKVQSFGRGMAQVGQTLTKVGAIATAGGALFVKQAIDFEKGLVSVQKTTNASASEMKVLEKDIRQLATTMPIAHGELTALASVAGQLGIKQKDIAEFTRVMAMMGTATDLSATDAAQALARFTNITGTSIDKVENLGSAIVHLGNNFATSESEIVNMAMGLVGTLSSLGVAEADILGISTALSSLGISAERGGSAVSKFFVNMTTAANEGGESLTQFSQVAGMTEQAFAKLVHHDPAKAFTSFINGLADIQAKGGSVVQTLDDMGITEVRLRDTLLRLVQGHEVLGSALNESNKAYQEGSALMNEYGLMAASTASQWEIAKNQFRDVAISIGQALLPAILEMLNQSDGLVDMAKGFAKWFTSLSDGTKKAIVQFGVLTPVIGSVLTTVGNLIDAGGNLLKLGSAIFKGIGKFSGLSKLAGLKDLNGDAISVGKALMGISPAAAIAGAALVGVGTFAYTATKDVRELNKAVSDFPDIPDIKVPQAESLRAMSESLTAINTELSLMDGANLGTVSDNMGTLADEIGRLNSEKIETLRKDFESLPKSVQAGLKESFDATIKNIEDQTSRVHNAMQRMSQLSEHAFDKNGRMYENYLLEAQLLADDMMKHYAVSLSDNVQQQQTIYQQLTKSISEMERFELNERERYVIDALKKERQTYKEHQEKLHKMQKEEGNESTAAAYYQAQERLQREHNTRMALLNQDRVRTQLEQNRRNFEDEKDLLNDKHKSWETVLKQIAKDTGVAYDEVERIAKATDLSEPFRKMSDEAKRAYQSFVTAMNSFAESKGITPDKLGTEHIAEFIEYAKTAGLTWKDIELLSKDANIDSNTKEFLEKVLEASSVWDRLTLEEKIAKLKTDGEEGLKDFIQNIEIWNSLSPEQKDAILNSIENGTPLADTLVDMGLWNELSLEEKIALMSTKGYDSLESLLDDARAWENLPDGVTKEAILKAIDNGSLTLEQFMQTWQGTEFQQKVAEIEGKADVGNAIGAFLLYWVSSILTMQPKTAEIKADDQATPKVNAAEEVVNHFDNLEPNVPLEATDNASEKVSKVQQASDKLGTSKPDTKLAATDNASQKIAGVQSKADKLGGSKPDTRLSATDNASRTISNVQSSANKLGASQPTPTLGASDRASGTIASVRNSLWNLNGSAAHTYVYTHHISTGRRAYSGTNRHVGGALILGDGGRQEPFLTPDGRFGVSPAHDTVYDLPYGTKVWSSLNRFRQEASASPYLASFLDKLPHFATGTKQSFLDDLTTIKLPELGKQEVSQSGDTLVFNIDLSVIGNSISRAQADKIIEPLIQSAERYSRKSRTKVNFGGVS